MGEVTFTVDKYEYPQRTLRYRRGGQLLSLETGRKRKQEIKMDSK